MIVIKTPITPNMSLIKTQFIVKILLLKQNSQNSHSINICELELFPHFCSEKFYNHFNLRSCDINGINFFGKSI